MHGITVLINTLFRDGWWGRGKRGFSSKFVQISLIQLTESPSCQFPCFLMISQILIIYTLHEMFEAFHGKFLGKSSHAHQYTTSVWEFLIKLMIFVAVHADPVVPAGSIDGCAVWCHWESDNVIIFNNITSIFTKKCFSTGFDAKPVNRGDQHANFVVSRIKACRDYKPVEKPKIASSRCIQAELENKPGLYTSQISSEIDDQDIKIVEFEWSNLQRATMRAERVTSRAICTQIVSSKSSLSRYYFGQVTNHQEFSVSLQRGCRLAPLSAFQIWEMLLREAN